MKNISGIKICYSCRGCEDFCAYNAIKFIKDTKTNIFYPKVDANRCHFCLLCIKKCQSNIFSNKPFRCFLLESKNITNLMRSSSGGAFYLLASIIISQDGIVYGAEYNKNMVVFHFSEKTIEGLKKIQKSKYVDSDISGIYDKIKKQLKSGKKILFSGTPCQIAGLKKYLNNEYENLFTIDFICTGVLSPIIFEKFINYFKPNNIEYFDWRYKHPTKDKFDIMDSAAIINGSVVQNDITKNIKKLYSKRYGFKESCYSCKYASIERFSDITLGDFWCSKSLFNNSCNMGTSVVLINTKKGYGLFNKINIDFANFISVDINKILTQNPALSSCTKRPINNNMFWYDLIYNKLKIEKLLLKYTKDDILTRLKYFISKILPQSILNFIHKIRYKH